MNLKRELLIALAIFLGSALAVAAGLAAIWWLVFVAFG